MRGGRFTALNEGLNDPRCVPVNDEEMHEVKRGPNKLLCDLCRQNWAVVASYVGRCCQRNEVFPQEAQGLRITSREKEPVRGKAWALSALLRTTCDGVWAINALILTSIPSMVIRR